MHWHSWYLNVTISGYLDNNVLEVTDLEKKNASTVVPKEY